MKTANPSASPMMMPPMAGPRVQQPMMEDQPEEKQQDQAEDPPAAAPLKAVDDAGTYESISPAPEATLSLKPDERFLSKEEKIEYRDQDGRLLNDEEVKALQGKVEFKTRYETRTRLVDQQGNEIRNELVGARDGGSDDGGSVHGGVAPQRPDTEGSNPETKKAPIVGADVKEEDGAAGSGNAAAEEIKAQRPAEVEAEKPTVGEGSEKSEARPASEANAATDM